MSVDILIANLSRAEEADRMYAAEDLGYANDPAALAPLCNRLLVEPSRAVREAIVAALGRLQQPEVIPALTELLQNEDPFVCNHVVQLLAAWKAAALPQVETLLNVGDDHARKLALDVLGRIHAEGTERLYGIALRDRNPNVVITAVEYIGANNVKALKPDIEAVFGQAQEPMLLTATLETLCQIGDGESLETILRKFPDVLAAPEMLCYSILKAIGQLGRSCHALTVARILHQGPARLVQPSVDALIMLRSRIPAIGDDPDLVGSLLALLERHISEMARYQILRFLAHPPAGEKLRDRVNREAQRLANPELAQGIRDQLAQLLPV